MFNLTKGGLPSVARARQATMRTLRPPKDPLATKPLVPRETGPFALPSLKKLTWGQGSQPSSQPATPSQPPSLAPSTQSMPRQLPWVPNPAESGGLPWMPAPVAPAQSGEMRQLMSRMLDLFGVASTQPSPGLSLGQSARQTNTLGGATVGGLK